VSELVRGLIVPAEPTFSETDPQIAYAVFECCGNDVVHDLIMFKELPVARRYVKPVESAVGTNPKRTGPVLLNSPNDVVELISLRHKCRSEFNVLKCRLRGIEAIKPAAIRANPYLACAIDMNRPDEVIRQTRRIVRVMLMPCYTS
jgi:hypothetical protein